MFGQIRTCVSILHSAHERCVLMNRVPVALRRIDFAHSSSNLTEKIPELNVRASRSRVHVGSTYRNPKPRIRTESLEGISGRISHACVLLYVPECSISTQRKRLIKSINNKIRSKSTLVKQRGFEKNGNVKENIAFFEARSPTSPAHNSEATSVRTKRNASALTANTAGNSLDG